MSLSSSSSNASLSASHTDLSLSGSISIDTPDFSTEPSPLRNIETEPIFNPVPPIHSSSRAMVAAGEGGAGGAGGGGVAGGQGGMKAIMAITTSATTTTTTTATTTTPPAAEGLSLRARAEHLEGAVAGAESSRSLSLRARAEHLEGALVASDSRFLALRSAVDHLVPHLLTLSREAMMSGEAAAVRGVRGLVVGGWVAAFADPHGPLGARWGRAVEDWVTLEIRWTSAVSRAVALAKRTPGASEVAMALEAALTEAVRESDLATIRGGLDQQRNAALQEARVAAGVDANRLREVIAQLRWQLEVRQDAQVDTAGSWRELSGTPDRLHRLQTRNAQLEAEVSTLRAQLVSATAAAVAHPQQPAGRSPPTQPSFHPAVIVHSQGLARRSLPFFGGVGHAMSDGSQHHNGPVRVQPALATPGPAFPAAHSPVRELEDTVAQLRARNMDLQLQLDLERVRSASSTTNNNNNHNNNGGGDDNRSQQLYQEIQRLQRQVQAKSEEAGALQAEVALLRTTAAARQSETPPRAAVSAEGEALRRDLEERVRAHEGLVAEALAMRGRMGALQEETRRSREEIASLRGELAATREELAAVTEAAGAERRRMQQAEEALRQACDAAQGELAVARAATETSARELGRARADVARLQAHVAEVEARRAESAARAQDLQAQMHALQQESMLLRGDNSALAMRAAELTGVAERARADALRMAEEVTRLQEQEQRQPQRQEQLEQQPGKPLRRQPSVGYNNPAGPRPIPTQPIAQPDRRLSVGSQGKAPTFTQRARERRLSGGGGGGGSASEAGRRASVESGFSAAFPAPRVSTRNSLSPLQSLVNSPEGSPTMHSRAVAHVAVEVKPADDGRVEELQDQLAKAAAELAAQVAENRRLFEDLEVLRREHAVIVPAVDAEPMDDGRVEELRDQLAKAGAELALTAAENRRLIEDLELLRRENVVVGAVVEAVPAQDLHADELRDRLAVAEAELAAKAAENGRLIEDLEFLRRQQALVGVESEVKDEPPSVAVAELQKKVVLLEEALREQQSRADKAAERAERYAREADVADHHAQVEVLQAELIKEVGTARAEIKQLELAREREVAVMRAEARSLQERFEAEVARERQALDEAKVELERARRGRQEDAAARAALRDKETRVAELESAVADGALELSELHARVRHLSAQNQTLAARLKDLATHPEAAAEPHPEKPPAPAASSSARSPSPIPGPAPVFGAWEGRLADMERRLTERAAVAEHLTAENLRLATLLADSRREGPARDAGGLAAALAASEARCKSLSDRVAELELTSKPAELSAVAEHLLAENKALAAAVEEKDAALREHRDEIVRRQAVAEVEAENHRLKTQVMELERSTHLAFLNNTSQSNNQTHHNQQVQMQMQTTAVSVSAGPLMVSRACETERSVRAVAVSTEGPQRQNGATSPVRWPEAVLPPAPVATVTPPAPTRVAATSPERVRVASRASATDEPIRRSVAVGTDAQVDPLPGLQRELEAARAEAAAAREPLSRLASAEARAAELAAEQASLEAAHRAARASADSLAQCERELERLRRRDDEARAEAARLAADRDRAVADLRVAAEQAQRLAHANDSLTRERDAATAAVAAARQSSDTGQADAERRLTALSREVATLSGDLEALAKRTGRLCASVTQDPAGAAVAPAASAEAIYRCVEGAIDALSARARAADLARARAEEALSAAEAQLSRAKSSRQDETSLLCAELEAVAGALRGCLGIGHNPLTSTSTSSSFSLSFHIPQQQQATTPQAVIHELRGHVSLLSEALIAAQPGVQPATLSALLTELPDLRSAVSSLLENRDLLTARAEGLAQELQARVARDQAQTEELERAGGAAREEAAVMRGALEMLEAALDREKRERAQDAAFAEQAARRTGVALRTSEAEAEALRAECSEVRSQLSAREAELLRISRDHERCQHDEIRLRTELASMTSTLTEAEGEIVALQARVEELDEIVELMKSAKEILGAGGRGGGSSSSSGGGGSLGVAPAPFASSTLPARGAYVPALGPENTFSIQQPQQHHAASHQESYAQSQAVRRPWERSAPFVAAEERPKRSVKEAARIISAEKTSRK